MHLRRTRVSTASRSWFVTARIAAGIPQMTLHDLRHTAASLAVSAGANVKAIQRMLGRASAIPEAWLVESGESEYTEGVLRLVERTQHVLSTRTAVVWLNELSQQTTEISRNCPASPTSVIAEEGD